MNSGKSGVLTLDEKQQYDNIQKNIPKQRENYAAYLKALSPETLTNFVKRCDALGLTLDITTGTISYNGTFNPIELKYELCYVRHGRTEGNTEPRIYQGQIDYPYNQLNAVGRQQAEAAAEQMEREASKWMPDLIIYSPLQRAIDTGEYFVTKHPNISERMSDGCAEMAFGSWDGQKVIDTDHESIAHLFYIDQNVIVKASEPHIVRDDWFENRRKVRETITAENFIDVLERIKKALLEINEFPEVKAIEGRKAHVLMYGHSMAGAAASILLGHGKTVPGTSKLGFDGSLIMPNATPTFLLPKKP